jgi:predicted dehydrogenase
MGKAKTYKTHQIFVHGSKGSVYVDDFTVFYQLNGEKEVQVVDLPADSCPTANFIYALQGKEHVFCSTADGARAAIAVEAAYESAKQGKPVPIEGWIE